MIAIFDMDGTILDTLEDLKDSLNYALEVYHMPKRTLKEVRRFVGNGSRRLIELAVPEGTANEAKEAVHEAFHAYYKDHCAIKTAPYPGIVGVIKRLKEAGWYTAVVSNKPEYGVISLCQDYFEGLFDLAVGDIDGRPRKPAPHGIYHVLKTFGISKEEAVYIGDSEVDLATAENAGLALIMVSWGFRPEAQLRELGAKEIAHSPAELEKLLLESREQLP